MKTQKKITYIIGIVFYALGLVLGLFIAGSSFMADIEAEFYGFSDLSKGRFSSLRCPTVLNRNETGKLRATFSNSLDRPIQPIVRLDLSSPTLEQSSRQQLSLDPGQTQVLEWDVDKRNIDLGNFIFAKAYIYPVYPLPLREATCGILVIDLPFLKGSQWLSLALVLSLVGMGVGLFLVSREVRLQTGHPSERLYALTALAIVVVAAIVCGLMGWWILGGILLVICILLIAVMLYLLT
jgi:hypothetical protein